MNKVTLLMAIVILTTSINKAQNQKQMEAHQISIRDNQATINYYQQGKGNTTLLFIHGWCINATYWESQLEYFSKNYNVYTIDLPGFGNSFAQRNNWSIHEYTNDVLAFIETLKLENIIIIGHSMAGEIILETALRNNPNIKGIIGVDNFKSIDVEFTPEQLQQMQAFFPMLKNDFKNSATAYADMMLFQSSTPQSVKNRVKTDFANSNPHIGYETCMRQMEYANTDAQKLEQLNYCLYLINCTAVPTNISGLKNHCKSGYYIENISSTSHYPMIENPNDFNDILSKIITKISK